MPPSAAKPPLRAALAITLTAVAGFVDAIGYLTLSQIYPANMSGNTIGLGMSWVEGHWQRAWERGWPVLTFVLGLLMGSVLFEIARCLRVRRLLTIAMALEAMLLAAFLGLGIWWYGLESSARASMGNHFLALAGTVTAAMGLQNASMRKVGAFSVYTTHVTGTVTKAVEDFTAYLFWLRGRLRGKYPNRFKRAMRVSVQQPAVREGTMLTLQWLGYLGGAAAGAWFRLMWGLGAIVWPLGVVTALGVFDLFHPSSLTITGPPPRATRKPG